MLSQLFKKKPSPENHPGIGAYAKDFFAHGYVHFCALAELFLIEVGEYSQVAKRRAIFAFLGALTLSLAYLAFWAILVLYLWQQWCPYGALLVFAGFHTFLSIIFLIIAWKAKPGPLAPMTKEELKTDLTCIKLSLNENAKH
ncbi:MAG: hypothetical protein R3Y56_00580 [Akkermansia sp.]